MRLLACIIAMVAGCVIAQVFPRAQPIGFGDEPELPVYRRVIIGWDQVSPADFYLLSSDLVAPLGSTNFILSTPSNQVATLYLLEGSNYYRAASVLRVSNMVNLTSAWSGPLKVRAWTEKWAQFLGSTTSINGPWIAFDPGPQRMSKAAQWAYISNWVNTNLASFQ
jgi:hypothetical protein